MSERNVSKTQGASKSGSTRRYNERAWASDLISHINGRAAKLNRAVKRARGEESVLVDGTYLFPDVMLYQDEDARAWLQGWELKMPDTPIGDPAFKENAEAKAAANGLNSYLLWNVTEARLYVRADVDAAYELKGTWLELYDITARAQVEPNEARWKAVADKIIDRLNDLFERGEIVPRRFIDAYASGGLTSLILTNSGIVRTAIADAARKDGDLDSAITLWWARVEAEYGGSDQHAVLAQANLINWIGKLLFAHILRRVDQRAAAVGQTVSAGPQAMLEVLAELSEQCNFITIFRPSIGQHIVPDVPWQQLMELNRFLDDHDLGSVDQGQLATLLEATASAGRRKVRGQYTTPPALAELLVRLTMTDATGRLFDPCCGSGTIARAAQRVKGERGVSAADITASVWASDVDPHALQLATFALVRPEYMGHVQHVFAHDAFDLVEDGTVLLRDPNTGREIREKIGTFDAITTNLPFVAQAGRKRFVESIEAVNARLIDRDDMAPFTGRADVAAYLPFVLTDLVKPGGRMGLNITNAWLSTDWGERLRENLLVDFRIRTIITAGAGRWFANADVVTNLLILEKRDNADGKADPDKEETQFVVLRRRLEDIGEGTDSKLIAAQIERGQTHDDSLSIRDLPRKRWERFINLGLGGSAQFVNCDWALKLPLVPLRQRFDTARGLRRGWNDFFYPRGHHDIEPEYLAPLLKNLRDANNVVTSANAVAFICDRTEKDLLARGDVGALGWIKRHENERTSTGRLQREARLEDRPSGIVHWYGERERGYASIVLPMNPNRRLFVPGLTAPTLIDQRVVGLASRSGTNAELGHALLNTGVGMFLLEGLGFGRGLGVLNLDATRFKRRLHMLDPSQLNDEAVKTILDAWRVLCRRGVYEFADELEEDDRRAFDQAVFDGYGIKVAVNDVYQSLLELVSIRFAAVDSLTEELVRSDTQA